MSQVKHLDATGESQRDIQKLREENGVLQDQVEVGLGFKGHTVVLFQMMISCH